METDFLPPAADAASPTDTSAAAQASAYQSRGLARYRCGHPMQALQDFDRAVRLNPRDVFSHYALGLTLMALGREDEARAHWRTAASLPAEDETAVWTQEIIGRLLHSFPGDQDCPEFSQLIAVNKHGRFQRGH